MTDKLTIRIKMETLNDRSWVDEMEDEESHYRIVTLKTPEKEKEPVETQSSSSRRKIFIVKDENACDNSLQSTDRGTDSISPKTNTSYAKILKSSSPEANSCKLPVSDATPKKDFLQEDISLSSHLDVFHVASPCKGKEKKASTEGSVVDKDEFPELSPWSRKMKNPTKKSHAESNDIKDVTLKQTVKSESNVDDQNSDPAARRRMLDDSKARRLPPDDVLMPSPSKITRQSTRNTENSPAASRTPRTPRNEHRKRQRDYSSPSSTGGSSRKYETDPLVLSRRQKQIDYGKNTVGYDRYIASVPKRERDKNHPQTPPMHLQYSRRAWDGLIKIWRKRLHFWDPPSEGGGDPALLEDDESIGDMSLDTSSVVSTPQQESKRRRGMEHHGGETKRAINNGVSMDDDDDEDGCKPLPIEDWILMGEGDVKQEEDEDKPVKIKQEIKEEEEEEEDDDIDDVEDDAEKKIKIECP
ncbi:YTH domain-containing protein 1 isoform X2 [Nilaparvata lugens]|uniref:YTH domain-containing protein 1 isoform X2 n=1 Tax=Nilaparvata lugens TaxID=108931 RepID=UPI00193E5A3C|nr:YTH domain-containing protein 1 isoform X2 [Nilaparvata lugens]